MLVNKRRSLKNFERLYKSNFEGQISLLRLQGHFICVYRGKMT